jgi:hypothetical protein
MFTHVPLLLTGPVAEVGAAAAVVADEYSLDAVTLSHLDVGGVAAACLAVLVRASAMV